MTNYLKSIYATVISCGMLLLTACSDPPYSLMFLNEADNANAGAKLTIMYKGRYYEKLPLLSLNQFSSFRSFPAADGSYGVALYVDKKYSQRLFTATAAKRNKLLLPVAGGLAYEPIRITGPITDGVLVVWGGLSGYDLFRISEKLRALKPEIEEKRYVEEDPRPAPEFKPSGDIQKDSQGRLIPQIPSAL